MVNFYRDMWPRRSQILAPLTVLTSTSISFKWTEEQDKAFKEMKQVMVRETLLAFPDFSKKFTIHTDASKTQLGAVISQNGKQIAFYSRKLNPAQTRYTTTRERRPSIDRGIIKESLRKHGSDEDLQRLMHSSQRSTFSTESREKTSLSYLLPQAPTLDTPPQVKKKKSPRRTSMPPLAPDVTTSSSSPKTPKSTKKKNNRRRSLL